MKTTTTKQPTLEDWRRYTYNSGCSCPFCGSPDIEGDSWKSEGHEVWQDVSCTACGEEWQDIYTLDRIGRTDGNDIHGTSRIDEALDCIDALKDCLLKWQTIAPDGATHAAIANAKALLERWHYKPI